MEVNMVSKTLKELYLNLQVSYKDTWGVDFDIISAKDMITRSYNSLTKLQSKMAANMSAKMLKYIFVK